LQSRLYSADSAALSDGIRLVQARGAISESRTHTDGKSQMRQIRQDAAQIARGERTFVAQCTQCHDADRALSRNKTLAGWRATVRRMAAKADANIPAADHEPIAAYLASLNDSGNQSGDDNSVAGLSGTDGSEHSVNIFGTVAPVWRGHSGDIGDSAVEHQSFFPDVWIGVEWQANDVMSARVTSCMTCHGESTQSNRVELAEGVFRFNVTKALDHATESELVVEAGRLIVPFGTSSVQSHPGGFRTATRPLMYNMGQNVFRADIGPPVLPMPYADEGVNARLSIPVGCDASITLDAWAVNGLQGGSSGISFFQSRDYSDNNREPAIGTRVTVGNSSLRVGASFMTGQYNTIPVGAPAPLDQVLNYELFGADVSWRPDDWLRFRAEYVVRNMDYLQAGIRDDEELEGLLLEGGVLLCDKPNIELVARYDTLDRSSARPGFGRLSGSNSYHVWRFTSGINWLLPGGSVLRLNHEHWRFPDPIDNQNILAVRWVATF